VEGGLTRPPSSARLQHRKHGAHPELYRSRIAGLVESIETAAALERKRTGRPVSGMKAILGRHSQYRPAKLSRSPAPLVHAATKAVRDQFYKMYSWFVAAFQDAAGKLRLGDRMARFPAGSFPPALPFTEG
jgi:hypothetical protein